MKRNSRGTSPYGYSLELEYALQNLKGKRNRWQGAAGSFANPEAVRDALRDAVRALRKRSRDITTYDDRLQLLLDIHFDGLRRSSGGLGKKSGAEVEVIAHLLSLIVHLLGYDWMDGSVNREVLVFQTRSQQLKDDRMRHPARSDDAMTLEWRERERLVLELHDAGRRVAQISQIMLVPEPWVKGCLVRAGRIKRSHNVKLT